MIWLVWVNLLHWLGLRKDKTWKCKIDVSVLIWINIIEALCNFKNLSSDATGDHGCSRGNFRNDLTCYHLSLKLVYFRYFIVSSFKVGYSMNKINMQVIITISIKFNWINTFRWKTFLIQIVFDTFNNSNIIFNFIILTLFL